MAYNQQSVPVNANINQGFLNGFNELNIKEEILIKEETNDFEVEEIFRDLAGDHLEDININDIIVMNSMDDLRAAADRMSQPNGISRTNAQALVRASKFFVKTMEQILNYARNYEASTHIGPDYDLQDETKICSLGWYVRVIRQTLAQKEQIHAAIILYRNSRCGSIYAFAKQYNASTELLSALRAHARNRYPNHNSYV